MRLFIGGRLDGQYRLVSTRLGWYKVGTPLYEPEPGLPLRPIPLVDGASVTYRERTFRLGRIRLSLMVEQSLSPSVATGLVLERIEDALREQRL